MAKVLELKVLNVAQPNAHNIIFDGKNVENRTSPTNLRGTVAIYGSKTYQRRHFEQQKYSSHGRDDCSFGCIVGFADVVDCIVDTQVTDPAKKWFQGPYGWVLSNATAIATPIEVTPPKGAVTWWTLHGNIAQKCVQQLGGRIFVPVTSLDIDSAVPRLRAKSGRTRLRPSAPLAAIVGSETSTLKKVMDQIIQYVEDKGLYNDETESVRCDSVLLLVFGKEVVPAEEFKGLVLKNLEIAD